MEMEELQKLKNELSNENFAFRRLAVTKLRDIGKPAIPTLIDALKDEHWVVRGHSANSLGRIGFPAEDVISALMEALGDDDWWVRDQAKETLDKLGKPIKTDRITPLATPADDFEVKASDPVFLGFLPKKIAPNSWGLLSHVREICSVCEHPSARPPGMFSQDREWNYNRACLYDDIESVFDDVPPEEQHEYDIFAYKAYSIELDKDGIHEIDILKNLPHCSDSINPNPDLIGFRLIGYDLIQEIKLLSYGCSPLSCNALANLFKVNEFCLIDDLRYAINAGIKFDEVGSEPPPYYIFEVYRKDN